MLTDAVLFQSESEVEHGLMVLWQMHESLAVHLEGKEAELFSMLLQVRYCNKFNVRALPRSHASYIYSDGSDRFWKQQIA